MELEPTFRSCIVVSCDDYYIIPIWNWSLGINAFIIYHLLITLFLYGIGALTGLTEFLAEGKNYIIPIWNWSSQSRISMRQS